MSRQRQLLTLAAGAAAVAVLDRRRRSLTHPPSQPGKRTRWTINERFVIGKPGNPMMERWRLIQTPLLGVYVHFIYREDLDPTPHDHPWAFVSLVLRGEYQERVWPDARVDADDRREFHGVGSVHRFPLRAAHRIEAVAPGTVTLVLVGPKVRTWGFWYDGQFIDYREALHLRPTEGDPAKRRRFLIEPTLTDHQPFGGRG